MFRLLFHSDVFVPNGFQEKVRELQSNLETYQLSNHFQEHLNNQGNEDRSHTYLENAVSKCLQNMKSYIQDAFEIELSKGYKNFNTSEWLITKYCIRVDYDGLSDLVIVIRPIWDKELLQYNPRENVVITAWLNQSTDKHTTLDDSRYCTEDKWKECNKNTNKNKNKKKHRK